MATIVTRAGKGSPLTWNDMDSNFTNLNNDKQENLPNQVGQNGKVLGTDGTSLSWVANGSGGGSVVVVNKYNGGAANYTLSTTPSTINNTQVIVNGIVLTPTLDYTLTGAVITPLKTWPTGINNIVIWTI